MLRQFINTVFFGNIGELVAPSLLKKYFKCSYFSGLAIIISERLIDLSVITFIFSIFLFFNDFDFERELLYSFLAIYILLIVLFLFIATYKKKILLIPNKVIKNLKLGINNSVRDLNILKITILFSLAIWSVFILIDFLLFKSFDLTSPISTLPNIIFLTGVMVFSQFIPAAPASIGIFNYFIIETIAAIYNAKGMNYDLTIQTELTSITIIILLIFLIPHITWGGYFFYKESLDLQKLKLKSSLKKKI